MQVKAVLDNTGIEQVISTWQVKLKAEQHGNIHQIYIYNKNI